MFTTFDTCQVCNRPGWCSDRAVEQGFLWCFACAHSRWRMTLSSVYIPGQTSRAFHVQMVDKDLYWRSYFNVSLN